MQRVLYFYAILGIATGAYASQGDTLWEYRISSGAMPDGEWGGMSSPALGDDGTVYVGSADSALYAINTDGNLRWRYKTGGRIDGGPVVGLDGTIYVGSKGDGYLYAVTAEGILKWRHDLQASGLVYTPAIDEGRETIYYAKGGSGGGLAALTLSGTLKWVLATGLTYRGSPTVARDGTIYALFYNGLIAVRPDGSEKWRYRTTSTPGVTTALDSDGVIYFGDQDGYLYAVSADGHLRWRCLTDSAAIGENDIGLWGTPVIGPDGTVYIGSTNQTGGADAYHKGVFYAIDANGTLRWGINPRRGNSYYFTCPAVGADGTVYTGRWSDRLEAFNADGTIKWASQAVLPNGGAGPAIGRNGVLYMPSIDGMLYAIDTGTSQGLAASSWPKFQHDARNTGMAALDSLAPTFEPVPARNVTEGATLQFTLSATDPDGDPLTYSMSGAPSGATLTGNVFTWTPTYQQSGTYTIVFVVSDGSDGSARQSVTITVQEVNRPPVLQVTGSLAGQEGLPITLAVSATDPDNDSLTVAVSGSPPGVMLTSGVFSWTPGYSAAGRYTPTFTASDGRGGQGEETVTIVVAERNGPPSLTRLAPQMVREMDSLQLVLSASDPDGERLTYVVSDNPAGSALTDSVFTWKPALNTRGIYRLRFAVADTRAGTDTATAVITVTARTRYITTSVDTLPFGAVSAGSSKSLSLTVSNAGTEALSVTNVIPGDPQYAVSTSSFSLLGGSSRDLTVTFTPVSGRSPNTTLTLVSNDPDRPVLTLPLTASTGVIGGPATLSVLPTSLSFGSVALGQSRSVTLVVTNDGGSNLRVLNIVSSSGDVTVSKSSFTLAAGAEELLTVTLQPTTAGSFSETLDIPSNDPVHPLLQVALRATVGTGGGRASLALDAASLSFGQVAIGETSEFLLPVRNAGTAALTISNVVSDNVQVVVSPTSLSIPPQETRSLTVRYRPMPGMSLSGRLTLYSNDTAQPQVGVAWSAVEVRSPYLSLTRVAPADGAFGVSTTAEIQLAFSEPLYYRRGFTALDVAVTPEPLSGPVEEDVQVRGDGRTVVIPVTLASGTVYRLVVYGATGWSGLELFDMVESSFSTGAAPPVLAKVSGRVAVATAEQVTGSIYLYDARARLAGQASLALDGSFELAGVQEGSYRLYLDGTLADGRVATGTYDTNGDGVADALTVRAGVDQTGLSLTATVRTGTAPVVSSGPVAVDLDSSGGNQGLASLGGVSGGKPVVLEVYATAADAWTGVAVTVAFDSTQVSYAGAEAGDNLLQKNGGTALFLSHVDPAASTVEFGGAILGPTATTAISGTGLLGRFRFTTVDGFTGETALRVTLVKVQSLTGRANVEPDLSATLRSMGSSGGTAGDADTGPLALDFNPADGDQAQRSGGSAVVGKQYVVQVFATGAPTINGWSAKVEYDPLQVRYVSGSFVPSSLVPGLTPLVEEKSDYVSIGGAVLGGSSSGSGTGLLGTATFEVLSGFTGSADLVIHQMSWKVIGSGEQMLTVLARGTITAAAAGLTGDFSGDGVVNFSDFFFFADAFGTTDAAFDLTGDGTVNFSDFFVFADAFGTEARGKLMELAQQYLGLPAKAGLESTYPNPFNATTTIRYRLSEPGAVKLAVYGLTGQRVASLVDARQESGTHEVTWDGTAEDGWSAATGVYLVRLESNTGVEVRRVTLLR